MATKEEIKELTTLYHTYVVECYRHLHANPELSFEEYETSKFIQQELTKMHIPFRSGIGPGRDSGRAQPAGLSVRRHRLRPFRQASQAGAVGRRHKRPFRPKLPRGRPQRGSHCRALYEPDDVSV